MNFLRYKGILRLSQVPSRSVECSCDVKLRFYSDSVYTSAAPHKFFKNNENTDVKYNNSKTSSFQNTRIQRVQSNDINDRPTKTGNFVVKNTYSSNFKKHVHDSNFNNNFYNNDYKSSNYKKKSKPYKKYTKFNNNYETNSSVSNHSNSSIDNYMDKFIDKEDTVGEYVDEELEDTIFFNEELLDEKSSDNKTKDTNFVKTSKQKQSAFKPNYTLRNNPSYKVELPNDADDTEEDKLEEDPNLQYIQKLGTYEESEDAVDEQEINQTKNHQVYHFDPNLTEFPDNDDSNDQTKIDKRKKSIQSAEGIIEYDLSSDEFNINKYLKELTNTTPLKPLEKCEGDISDFGPGLGASFNFASYANKSELVQEYVKLGVKLYKVEKDMDHMRALLTVDLKDELPVYIQFLHDCGVPADHLGDVITENPMILKEDLDDMKTRIRYLRAHDFSVDSIARIVTKNPTWLTWATKHIDERLGHFQNEFKLTGPEVRFLATKQPKLITYKFRSIHENTFAVRELMGFDKKEIKALLLSKPRLWMNSRKKIVDSFDYLHNTMKLSHLMIVSQPDTLTCRKSRLQNRHEFLVELNKVQYDPKKPNYISPTSLACGSDVEFCRDVAKTSIDTYNLFIKTR